MTSSTRSDSFDSAIRLNRRTAVCGPACTVVWEGEGREAPPYPDRGRPRAGSADHFASITPQRGHSSPGSAKPHLGHSLVGSAGVPQLGGLLDVEVLRRL